MGTIISEEHRVSKIAFYQIFTAVNTSILYFKSKCMSELIHAWEWYCMLCFLIQSVSFSFCLSTVAVITALLPTQLEFTVHFAPEIHLILISNFRRVLNLVCILLGISLASGCCMPTFRNALSVPSS